MRSGSKPNAQKPPTFIEEARRRQIVEKTVETIARNGTARTSLAEIARAAGISKGVISYHFGGKDELIEAVLDHLAHEPAQEIKARVERERTAPARLAAYVRAQLDHLRSHRDRYLAFVDLWSSVAPSRGRERFVQQAYEPARHYLGRIVEEGLAEGTLAGDVPPRIAASVIQAALDGVMLQWLFDPEGTDLDACGDAIVALIERGLAGGASPAAEEDRR